LQRHLVPPAPWTDIYRGFADVDAALDRASFWERLARLLQAPLYNAKRWAPAAVALMVLFVLFYRFRQTPSVQAAELLRKAIAAADGLPQKPRRIQIRTRDHSLTRVAGAADTDALRSLQVLFQAAHYDWADPLSARAYQAWRDRLADKQDEVVEERDAYRIRTRTGSGELIAATLKIRIPDLRPVEERLEFRNREWIEITEVAGDPAPPATIAASGGHPTARDLKTPPTAGASTTASTSATAGDEVRVLAALNRVGADLGDPIEVSRAGGEILVSGVGIAPQRQQEIKDALRSQTHVAVRFSESAPEKVQPEPEAPTDGSVNADIERLQARVASRIGGRVYFAQLASQVLDLTEPMMSRAYALRRLAEQFPAEVESELTGPDRRLLGSLVSEHTDALRRHAAELDRLLRPALGPVSATPDGAASSGAWQPATEELFQSARRVDTMIAVLFGAAAGDTPGEQSPAQLLSSLAQLRTRLDAYDDLSKQALGRTIK